MAASAPPGAPPPNPPPPNPSWNASESDAESDDEFQELINTVKRNRKERTLREAELEREKAQRELTPEGEEKEQNVKPLGQIVAEAEAERRRHRAENQRRALLAKEWWRMQGNVGRCSRADRAAKMSECEREMVADGESTENGRFWCAPEVLANPLMTAANNGQAEVVAHLCSMAPISLNRLLNCALRALLFGHMEVVNVLVAYMGSGGLTMDDERIVTEMTRVRRNVPGASVDYQEEIIRAVLNQQADVVSALLDRGHVTGQVVSGLGRVAHQDYVAGIDCALILAVTRGHHDILLHILQHCDTLSEYALNYLVALGLTGIFDGTLLSLAVMAGDSQVLMTVLQHHQPTQVPELEMKACLSLARRYHRLGAMKILLDLLRQKLACMQPNNGTDITDGVLLQSLSISPDSLQQLIFDKVAKGMNEQSLRQMVMDLAGDMHQRSLQQMVLDILVEAMHDRSRTIVVLITERFSSRDLNPAPADWSALFSAVQHSSSVPILRLFIQWGHSHIQNLRIERSLVTMFPTMVNMLVAAGAQMQELCPYACSNPSLPAQEPLSLLTTAMRQVHLGLCDDYDLVAAVDRLPISPAMKRLMLFRSPHPLAYRRAQAFESCGSAAASPPVEEVKPETAEASQSAACECLSESDDRPVQTAKQSTDDEKMAVDGERELVQDGSNDAQDKVDEKYTDYEELD